jgi:hypothetical protein
VKNKRARAVFIIMILVICAQNASAKPFSRPTKTIVVGTLSVGWSLLWIDQWTVGGLTYVYPWTPTATFAASIDASIISPKGLTLVLGDLMNVKAGYGLDNNFYFGAGWHYVTRKWSAGAALCFSPVLPGDGRSDCLIAVKVDGTWWFSRYCGLAFAIFGGASTTIGVKSAVFDQQIGISIRT